MTYQTMCLIDFAQLVAVKPLNISVYQLCERQYGNDAGQSEQAPYHHAGTGGHRWHAAADGGDTADDISIDGYASVSKERCEEAPEGQDDPDQPDQLLHHQGTALVLKKKSRNEQRLSTIFIF